MLARSIAERKVRVEAGQIIIVKERMSKATGAASARRRLLERPSATRMILCSRAVEFSSWRIPERLQGRWRLPEHIQERIQEQSSEGLRCRIDGVTPQGSGAPGSVRAAIP